MAVAYEQRHASALTQQLQLLTDRPWADTHDLGGRLETAVAAGLDEGAQRQQGQDCSHEDCS